MYEKWIRGPEIRHRFSDESSAKDLLFSLGFGLGASGAEEFMERAIFNTLEKQFADLGWPYPNNMDWKAFVSSCKNVWIRFDYISNFIYLANNQEIS